MATKKLPVAYSVPSSQSDFPTLVQPSVMTGWGSLTTAEAQSIRFYTDSSLTTEIAREVVDADEIWVKIPTLTSSTEIWADYDGVRADYAVTDTYGRNAVWSNYLAVYHLEGAYNGTAGEVTDSTGNSNDGRGGNGTSGEVPTQTTGKIGNAQDFDGSDDDIFVPGTNFAVGTGNVTVSSWFNTSRATAQTNSSMYVGYAHIKDASNYDGYFLEMRMDGTGNAGKLRGRSRGTSGGEIFTGLSTATFNNGNWHHGVFVRNGNGLEVFANGSSVATGTGVSAHSYAATNDMAIGTNPIETNNTMDGNIDEVRIIDTALSANWITTEYNNQNSPGTFWGTVVDAGTVRRSGILAYF